MNHVLEYLEASAAVYPEKTVAIDEKSTCT